MVVEGKTVEEGEEVVKEEEGESGEGGDGMAWTVE